MLDFFKSKVTKNVFSVLSVGFPAFIIWLIFISYSYAFAYDSFKVLYTVFIIINLLFGVLLLYTRSTVLTNTVLLICFPVNLILTIFSVELENWLLFIPPLAVNCIVFFFGRFKYTTKILVSILTIVMFVLGILGYIVFNTLFGNIPFYNFSDSKRVEEVLSPSAINRYVVYERVNDKSKKIDIYAESCNKDIDLKIITLKKLSDDHRIWGSREQNDPEITWENDNTLIVNGQKKVIDFSTAAPLQ